MGSLFLVMYFLSTSQVASLGVSLLQVAERSCGRDTGHFAQKRQQLQQSHQQHTDMQQAFVDQARQEQSAAACNRASHSMSGDLLALQSLLKTASQLAAGDMLQQAHEDHEAMAAAQQEVLRGKRHAEVQAQQLASQLKQTLDHSHRLQAQLSALQEHCTSEQQLRLQAEAQHKDCGAALAMVLAGRDLANAEALTAQTTLKAALGACRQKLIDLQQDALHSDRLQKETAARLQQAHSEAELAAANVESLTVAKLEAEKRTADAQQASVELSKQVANLRQEVSQAQAAVGDSQAAAVAAEAGQRIQLEAEVKELHRRCRTAQADTAHLNKRLMAAEAARRIAQEVTTETQKPVEIKSGTIQGVELDKAELQQQPSGTEAVVGNSAEAATADAAYHRQLEAEVQKRLSVSDSARVELDSRVKEAEGVIWAQTAGRQKLVEDQQAEVSAPEAALTASQQAAEVAQVASHTAVTKLQMELEGTQQQLQGFEVMQ